MALQGNSSIVCREGHRFEVDERAPVLFDQSRPQPVHATFPLPSDVRLPERALAGDEVDPFVQSQVAATCGNLYVHLVGKLRRYPIPVIPVPHASPGQVLVDIGASWGRWSVAAAKLGYTVLSVEPWGAASQACGRVARQLGVDKAIAQVHADAGQLPFDDESVDVFFSYSVIQHFTREHAASAFQEAARVLKPGGLLKVQMPNRLGVRQTWNRYRHSEEGQLFGVRMWSLSELESLALESVGPASFEVDGFFGLGIQASDLPLLSRKHRAVVRGSLLLTAASRRVPMLAKFADSVWVVSRKR